MTSHHLSSFTTKTNTLMLNTTLATTQGHNLPADNNQTCLMDESILQIPLMFFYSLFFAFGLVGNVLALYVFLYVHTKNNSVRIFLINTAVADLILIACLPFRVHYHSQDNKWTLGPVFCKVVGNIFYTNMYVSITLLGLISVDRYVKIQRAAIRSRIQNSRRWSIIACSAIWVFSVAVTVPMIALSEGNEEPGKCFQYKQRLGAKGKAYFNFFVVTAFWLVFFCLIVSYGKIAQHLLATSRAKPDLPNAQKYSRTAKKSFFVLFIYTVCFVPYHTFRIFYVHTQITQTPCSWRRVADKTNEVALLFSTFNSCLDPVMYFLLSGSVRRATFRIVGNLLHRQDSSANSSTTELHRITQSQTNSTPRHSLSLINTLRAQRPSAAGFPPTGQD